MSKKTSFTSEDQALQHFGANGGREADGTVYTEEGGCYGKLVFDEEDRLFYVDWLVY